MYLLYYGFSQEPFHTTPDPEFLYLSPSHKEAIASIIYGVERRKGFVAVVGEVGVGKTTVLRSFIEKIDTEREKAIYLLNPRLAFTSLLKNILDEFGENTKDLDDDEMVHLLHEHLIEEYKHDRTVILIIDEAQNVPIQTLEQLRMLSNLETSMDKLLQIVLIGQPELDLMLRKHELRQLRQRIAIRATIRPLTEKESVAYILHRLDRVLTRECQIFTRGALKLLVTHAEGIPRRINILCDNALITGFGSQQNPITSKIVKEVVADIDGDESSKFARWVPIGVGVAGVFAIFMGLMLLIDGKSIPADFLEIKNLSSIEEKGEQLATSHSPRDLSQSKTPNSGKKELSNQKDGKVINVTERNVSENGPSQTMRVPREARDSNQVGAEGLGNSSFGLESSLNSFPIEEQAALVEVGKHPSLKKIVKRGDTLSKLIEKVYGDSSPTRVARVLQDNPHIRYARRIYPGQEVVFTDFEKEVQR